MVLEASEHKNKNSAFLNISKKPLYPVCFYNHNFNGSQNPEISVIMPALNEERAVGNLLDSIQNILQKITFSYEIIVIDDGSKDRTLDICRKKNVTIIHNRYNYGKGYALREGFKQAHGNIIVTIDSDGDHHPEEIPSLLHPILNGKAEIALGTRFAARNSKIPITTAINTFGNMLFNFLIRRLTNYKFSDTQCGFRAFKRNCLLHFHLESLGYDIETEMIIQIALQNIRYCEIPISSRVTYFRKSNINRIKDGFRILFTIFKTRFRNLAKR